MKKRMLEPRQRTHLIAPPDNSRKRVIKALDDAWREGHTFTLHANTNGQVDVIINRTRIFTYDDIGQCIHALFPDHKR